MFMVCTTTIAYLGPIIWAILKRVFPESSFYSATFVTPMNLAGILFMDIFSLTVLAIITRPIKKYIESV